jgi:hypothetical protein
MHGIGGHNAAEYTINKREFLVVAAQIPSGKRIPKRLLWECLERVLFKTQFVESTVGQARSSSFFAA